jgi:hypothetical protein
MKAAMIIPKLTSIDKLVLHNDELFVAAGGFEERACKFPEILEFSSSTRNTTVLLNYLPYKPENRFEEIQSSLNDRGCEVVPVEYNLHSPFNFDIRFSDILISSRAKAICLDISGMSRLAIMIILDIVHELNLSLRIVYAEACRYAPSQEEFEAAKRTEQQHLPTSFIQTGVYDVLHVSRLTSIRMQNHATLLIAFDSFNESLCQALVNVINPSRFILINGRPPRQELRWREQATAYVHKFLRREWSIEDDNDPIKTTSTLNYEETYEMLVNLYWRFSGSHRIILSPTGSKMQTIGSYLLRSVHNDVHIEYPTAQGFFADKYSTGVRETWQLVLGRMGDFVEHLRQKEIKEHLGLPEELTNADVD